MKRLLLVLVCALVLSSASSAQQPPSQNEQTASLLERLAACQVEDGQLMTLRVAIVRGAYLDQAAIVKKFEAANPGKTLDAAWKVVDVKPKAEKQP